MFYDNQITGNLVCGNDIYNCDYILRKIAQYKKALIQYKSGDRPVALCLPRGKEIVLCMVSLLELGIPFIAIDRKTPHERLLYMLKNINASCTICNYNMQIEGVQNVYFDTLVDSVHTIEENPEQVSEMSSIAYYIYTSGTTGNPKAVMIKRSNLNNFFYGINQAIPFQPEQRIINLTSISFDIVFLELLYSLYNNLTVVLTTDEQIINTKEVCRLLTDKKIDIIQLTPSRLKMIEVVDSEFTCLAHIKFILVGGEQVTPELMQKLQKYTKARIFNMYGPTETTVWSTIGELTDSNKVTIGKPIANTDIYILNENNEEILDNTIGEIAIGGLGVGPGYFNNKTATNHSFLYWKRKGKRVYKTGDLGSRDSFGFLYCYGRKDNQIKLNGHRIELEDIDENIKKLNIVSQSVTCYYQEKVCLVTYYLSNNRINHQDLIIRLKRLLPEYMVPRYYIKVDQILYTLSGKVDRNKMLQQYELYDEEFPAENKSDDEATQKILKIIENTLSVKVDMEEKLENIIPDSILYLNIIVAVEEEFEIEFDDDKLDLGQIATVESFVEYVKQLQ